VHVYCSRAARSHGAPSEPERRRRAAIVGWDPLRLPLGVHERPPRELEKLVSVVLVGEHL
jgi:hypothetical protein